MPRALPLLLAPLLLALPPPPPVRAQVQLRCDGTLLEARGSAERRRPARWLRLSLSLEAEAAGADAALALLQARLAAVREGLRALAVEELRVTSPHTWPRAEEPRRPAAVLAGLQVSGRVAPQRLQGLVRGVGSLPGVRLAPVTAEADPADAAAVRRELLQAAYRDARLQAGELAAVIGRPRLAPLELQVEGGGAIALRGAAAPAEAPPPFDPGELESPVSRLSLLVRFCAS